MRLFGQSDASMTARNRADKAEMEARKWIQASSRAKAEADRASKETAESLRLASEREGKEMLRIRADKERIFLEVAGLETRRAEAMVPVIESRERQLSAEAAADDVLRDIRRKSVECDQALGRAAEAAAASTDGLSSVASEIASWQAATGSVLGTSLALAEVASRLADASMALSGTADALSAYRDTLKAEYDALAEDARRKIAWTASRKAELDAEAARISDEREKLRVALEVLEKKRAKAQ